MKVRVSLLHFLIVPMFSMPLFGQLKTHNKIKPFSLLIISPDSISLDKSLKHLVDTVETAFRDTYYSYLERMELFKQFEPEEKRQETEQEIQRMKLAEMDIHDIRYFHFIPMLTCSELWYLFNQPQDPDFSFDFVDRKELYSYDLSKLTAYYGSDYILTYKEISTSEQNSGPLLKITVQLFSKKDSKMIYEKTTFGYSRFYRDASGELRGCNNDLQCMLESGAISSTIEIFKFLERRQKK